MCTALARSDIEQLLAGELPAKRQAAVRRHLTSCSSCQAVADEISSVAELEAMRQRSRRALPQTSLQPAPRAEPAPTDKHEGKLIDGRYRTTRLLGQGGMGMVFLAEDMRLRRQVAVKLLRADRMDGASRRRFIREARAVAAIDNDHVVRLFSVSDTDDPQPYLVMQFIDGHDLATYLKTGVTDGTSRGGPHRRSSRPGTVGSAPRRIGAS